MSVRMFFPGILLWVATAFSAEDYSQWRYYRTVTINTTATGANVSATQRNFPTLVRLNSSNFDFTKALRTGADVRFAKTNGVLLPYQIEQWDSVGHFAAVWVLLDTVPGNNNWTFRMYYGKAGAVDSSKGSPVFDTANGFQAVFHLAEATNDTAHDATANHFKGVPHNFGGLNPKDTLGMIGHSKNFLGHDTTYHPLPIQDSGGNYRILTSLGNNTYTNNPLNFQNDSATRNGLPLYTISSWINVRVFPLAARYFNKGIIAKSKGTSGAQYHVGLPLKAIDGVTGSDSNRVDFSDGPRTMYKASPHWTSSNLPYTDFPPKTWAYLTVVRTGFVGAATSLRICLNTKYFLGDTSTTATIRSDYNVTIGSFSNDSGFFPGLLDEVRFENVARDSMWIRLNYWTQRPDSSAVSVGDETTVGLINAGNPLASKNGLMNSWVIHVNGTKPLSFHVKNGASTVRLSVENMDGRVMWSSELKADPNGMVFWNGTAENGKSVSPGMYVVRMKEQ